MGWFGTWLKDMLVLVRKHRQAVRDEKESMRKLMQWMRENP